MSAKAKRKKAKKQSRGRGKVRAKAGAASSTHGRTARRGKATRKWSKAVMQRSDALDLEEGVFTKRSAKQIASSLKRSAVASRRRKSDAFRSAMSMLNFHINRGGKGLTPERRRVLNNAKQELRVAFHRAARDRGIRTPDARSSRE